MGLSHLVNIFFRNGKLRDDACAPARSIQRVARSWTRTFYFLHSRACSLYSTLSFSIPSLPIPALTHIHTFLMELLANATRDPP